MAHNWRVIFFIALLAFVVDFEASATTLTPTQELCQWLYTDCPPINQKTIPTMDPTVPLNIQVFFFPTHLLAIDEIAQKFVTFSF